MGDVFANEIAIPIIISLAITFFLMVTGQLLLNDTYKISFLIFIFLFLNFYFLILFTNFSPIIKKCFVALNVDIKYVRFRYLTMLFVVPLFYIYKKYDLMFLTRLLNIISFSLVAMTIISISTHFFSGSNIYNKSSLENSTEVISKAIYNKTETPFPDIYYIILDSYTSNSTLKNYYDFDNREITDFLESQNFFIATKSHSNYTYTQLSLPSSLNMMYLDSIKSHIVSSNYKSQYQNLMLNSKETKFLRSLGYRIVVFDDLISDNYNLKEHYSDIYFKQNYWLTGFQSLVINSYAIKLLFNPVSSEIRKKKNVIFTFSKLTQIPDIKGPTFTFAHISAPHVPFVFDSTGNEYPINKLSLNAQEPLKYDQYKLKYINEVIFINNEIKNLIEIILRKSSVQPIIILQGDHGSRASAWCSITQNKNPNKTEIIDWTSIFNVYHLPHGGDSLLYDAITPVNSFRIINDYYFGSEFGVLEDRIFFSNGSMGPMFNWIDVTDSLIIN